MLSFGLTAVVSIAVALGLVGLGAYFGVEYGKAQEAAGQKRTVVVHRYETEAEAPTFGETVEE